MNRNSLVLTFLVIGIGACCCVAVLVAFGGLAAVIALRSTGVPPILTEVFVQNTPTPEPVIVLTPVPTPLPGVSNTLDVLQAVDIPPRDLRTLAMRLLSIPDIPEVVSTTPANHQIGDEVEFQVSNAVTNQNFPVTARLVYESDNAYFFVEDGLQVDEADVKALVDDFQANTYPTNREFYGSEWTPGVDGDPHLYMVYASGLGATGYYSSKDEYSRLAHEYSNEKEIFFINADHVSPGEPYVRGILAHEFQHMIHWFHDINEETWMNEGSAELAAFINGHGASEWAFSFVSQPDLQLNAWSESGSGGAHYGSGFLFMDYFLDRFGSQTTRALVADPANGLRAVDDVLAAQGITDPATGQPVTTLDVFGDWVIANYLGDDAVADGRYEYHNYPDAPTVAAPTDAFYTCPVTQSATVYQFGADYYQIRCAGELTLSFTGSQQVRVVPTEPDSGRYVVWSHRNDESDTTLTREFDLTGVGSASFEFRAWWELETDWDYVYLLVSSDGGQSWTIIETPSGTDYDPSGNNFGWGYTGDSGGGSTARWIHETVDLSAYAGQRIQVRFEYVTDAAVNRPGFLLDDITIPEIGFSTDFEAGDGGWVGSGFVRIDNLLPQTFLVQLVREDGQTTVERLPLDANNQGSLTLQLEAGASLTLVVSGTTRYTTEPASYEFKIER